jgi:hypothetical protein
MNFTKSDIAGLCLRFAPLLKLDGITDDDGKPVNKVSAMFAFAGCESSFGADCTPRFEKAYWQGSLPGFPDWRGKYSQDPRQLLLNEKYGKLGASSHGIFQIMLCNAIGFVPSEFKDLEKNGQAFIGFLNRYVERERLHGRLPRNLAELADMYNSGNARDAIVPHEYIDKFRKNYFNEVIA